MINVYVSDPSVGNKFEVPFKAIEYVEELNNGGNCRFDFDYATIKEQVCVPYSITVAQLFTTSFREIWIEKDGTKIWYGVITDYNRNKDANGNYTLQVAAVDYFSIFQKRRTASSVVFTAVDPATIPWSLINTSQGLTSGNFGITQGATASTGLSVTIEYKLAEIRQAISDLSNFKQFNSFDFDIDYTKKLNIYYPAKGSSRPNIVLDDNNILGDAVHIPVLTNLTNSIYVTGQGINNDIYVNRQASAPTIAAYGLLEDVISDSQVSDTTLLNAEGDRNLALFELPLYELTVKHDGSDPDILNYGLGDTIVVNIVEEAISYQSYRVKKRTVDIDESSTILVTLDLLTI